MITSWNTSNMEEVISWFVCSCGACGLGWWCVGREGALRNGDHPADCMWSQEGKMISPALDPRWIFILEAWAWQTLAEVCHSSLGCLFFVFSFSKHQFHQVAWDFDVCLSPKRRQTMLWHGKARLCSSFWSASPCHSTGYLQGLKKS